MSDLGSFVSQWFYCEECREALAQAVSSRLDWFEELPHADILGGPPRIIAGRIGGMAGGDAGDRARTIAEFAAKRVCHPVVFTVITGDLRVLVYSLVPGQPPTLEVVSTSAAVA